MILIVLKLFYYQYSHSNSKLCTSNYTTQSIFIQVYIGWFAHQCVSLVIDSQDYLNYDLIGDKSL